MFDMLIYNVIIVLCFSGLSVFLTSEGDRLIGFQVFLVLGTFASALWWLIVLAIIAGTNG